MKDIRDDIFKEIIHKEYSAKIVANDKGIIAGCTVARQEAEQLGLNIIHWQKDGTPVTAGDKIASFTGTPRQIAMAEEVLIGHMAKPSGIATAAKKFVDKSGGQTNIVSGSWKKMPFRMKDIIRNAVSTGGAAVRISDAPFIYLDKNYIKMLGGISGCLRATEHLRSRKRVVQIHGHFGSISSEACEAAESGSDIIFIDTGRIDDAIDVIQVLKEKNLRQQVQIAFAGGIRLQDIDRLKGLDIDFLDVGRSIVDAPLLDMRIEVDPISHY